MTARRTGFAGCALSPVDGHCRTPPLRQETMQVSPYRQAEDGCARFVGGLAGAVGFGNAGYVSMILPGAALVAQEVVRVAGDVLTDCCRQGAQAVTGNALGRTLATLSKTGKRFFTQCPVHLGGHIRCGCCRIVRCPMKIRQSGLESVCSRSPLLRKSLARPLDLRASVL